MRNWQPDIFIKVEHLYLRPLNAEHRGQGIQKFELRGARRGNDSCSPPALYRVAERNSGLFRSRPRSEEHTSELQSHSDLVCRLLLEKKKNTRFPDEFGVIAVVIVCS